MRLRSCLIGATVAMAITAPAHAQVSPKAETPAIAYALPIAVGALVGGTTTFFILPLIIPAMAGAAPAVGPVVGTPLFGAIGAVTGGVIGYTMFRAEP